jgi:hypothetical protein
MQTRARDLMEWLVLDDIPLDSTITLDEIYSLYFYARIPPDQNKEKIVGTVINNLIDRGFITREENTFTKRYYMDR